MAKEQEQQTMEEYLLSQLDAPVVLKACKMMIDGIADSIKQGYIVDLGVLGRLYPAVNGNWSEDPEALKLSDMKPKVNYKAGDDIAAARKGAQLSWTTEAETEENTVSDEDNETPTTPTTPTNGDNQGGNNDSGDGME